MGAKIFLLSQQPLSLQTLLSSQYIILLFSVQTILYVSTGISQACPLLRHTCSWRRNLVVGAPSVTSYYTTGLWAHWEAAPWLFYRQKFRPVLEEIEVFVNGTKFSPAPFPMNRSPPHWQYRPFLHNLTGCSVACAGLSKPYLRKTPHSFKNSIKNKPTWHP